jgi:hypothetical protein
MSAMAKQLSTDLTYDAPLADVTAMLADPAFRERVLDAQHAGSRTVTIAGGAVTIVYTRSIEGKVPGVAKKFVGDSIEVRHEETWDPAFTRGDIAIRLPGKPGEVTGTATLAERDGRTVETVTLTATVSIPVVAGKLEDLILSTFRQALAREQQVGRAWLKGE